MKHSAYLYRIIGITTAILFLVPQIALADSSTSVNISDNGSNSQNDVNVQTNTGGNTICQNGNCTTTSGGNGQSTVCINGQCQTSSGNIDMQSDNGNDQVNVTNNSSGTSVTVSPAPTEVPVSISPESSVSISSIPTINLSPTITQLRKHIRGQIKKQIQQLKEHMKDQDQALSSWMQSFQNMLNGMFK